MVRVIFFGTKNIHRHRFSTFHQGLVSRPWVTNIWGGWEGVGACSISRYKIHPSAQICNISSGLGISALSHKYFKSGWEWIGACNVSRYKIHPSAQNFLTHQRGVVYLPASLSYISKEKCKEDWFVSYSLGCTSGNHRHRKLSPQKYIQGVSAYKGQLELVVPYTEIMVTYSSMLLGTKIISLTFEKKENTRIINLEEYKKNTLLHG